MDINEVGERIKTLKKIYEIYPDDSLIEEIKQKENLFKTYSSYIMRKVQRWNEVHTNYGKACISRLEQEYRVIPFSFLEKYFIEKKAGFEMKDSVSFRRIRYLLGQVHFEKMEGKMVEGRNQDYKLLSEETQLQLEYFIKKNLTTKLDQDNCIIPLKL